VLYHKPSSLAMFFGQVNVGRRVSMKLVLNCKADKEGGKIKQLLLQNHCPLMISRAS